LKISDGLKNGAESVSAYVSDDGRFLWVKETYSGVSESYPEVRMVIEKRYDGETDEWTEWVFFEDAPGSTTCPEGGDTKPTGPHEVFDSVFFVYANLRVETPPREDTPIDIFINPRSVTGDAAADGDATALLRFQTVACAGGLEVGLGPVDILPFVGNRDPNPLNPGSPGASSGISPTLIAALSVRDPMPIW